MGSGSTCQDREGLRKTCFGMFLVLADARITRRSRPTASRPKSAVADFVEQGFVHLSPIRQLKRAHKGPFLIGGQGGIRTLERLLTVTHFPGVRLQPLGHLSVTLGRR